MTEEQKIEARALLTRAAAAAARKQSAEQNGDNAAAREAADELAHLWQAWAALPDDVRRAAT